MKTKTPPPRNSLRRADAVVALFASAVFATFAGCASEPESHVVSAPPPASPPAATAPVVVQTAPQAGSGTPLTPGQAVVVTQAPPAPRQEPVLEQPSPRHVWIPGYWTYRDSHYVWIAGRWELPPHDGAVWVSPHWEREGNAFRYYEGYWE